MSVPYYIVPNETIRRRNEEQGSKKLVLFGRDKSAIKILLTRRRRFLTIEQDRLDVFIKYLCRRSIKFSIFGL